MKTISELFNNINIDCHNVDIYENVSGVAINSKSVTENNIFFALKDNTYTLEAIKNGAICVVTTTLIDNAPCIVVDNIRQVVCLVCANFYDNPQVGMNFIGVVGTNGKTTTTHIINHLLVSSGKKTCLIGTLGAKVCEESFPLDMTTPDPNELYRILSIAKQNNVEFVIMEISAHAIFFEKLYNIMIDFCVFTNISQDHLDFFGTMNEYTNTKLSFFSPKNVRLGIINIDDKMGQSIINKREICCVSYGLYHPSDIFALDIAYGSGTSFVANVFDDIMHIKSPLLGEFNVSNMLASLAVAKILGIRINTICESVKTLPQIVGRFDVITMGKTAIIDYAHTPDGLQNALIAAQKMTKGNLILVFGCGGNRDKTKRPIMGKIAAKYCDIAVITSDNPRMEEPEQIIEDIVQGFLEESHSYIKITDRKKAIKFALSIASNNDIVLIAGKGGENYIDIMGVKYPYSDREVCEEILRRNNID